MKADWSRARRSSLLQQRLEGRRLTQLQQCLLRGIDHAVSPVTTATRRGVGGEGHIMIPVVHPMARRTRDVTWHPVSQWGHGMPRLGDGGRILGRFAVLLLLIALGRVLIWLGVLEIRRRLIVCLRLVRLLG